MLCVSWFTLPTFVMERRNYNINCGTFLQELKHMFDALGQYRTITVRVCTRYTCGISVLVWKEKKLCIAIKSFCEFCTDNIRMPVRKFFMGLAGLRGRFRGCFRCFGTPKLSMITNNILRIHRGQSRWWHYEAHAYAIQRRTVVVVVKVMFAHSYS